MAEEAIQPYQFEPEYSDSEIENITIVPEVRAGLSVDNLLGRKDNIQWCNCNHCVSMLTDHESLCCSESESVRRVRGSHECIIDHQSFLNLIISKDALNLLRHQTIRKTSNRKKRNTLTAENLPNNSWRYLAYKQFVIWICASNTLGKSNRIVLPSCVVSKIREQFPTPNADYVGYQTARAGDTPKISESRE